MFLIGVIAASLAAVAYGMSTVLRALGARRAAQIDRDEGIETTNAAGGPTLRSTASTFVDPAFILGTVLVTVGFAAALSRRATCRCSCRRRSSRPTW